MTQILDYSSQSSTGLKFRKPTFGPEYEMVKAFVSNSLPKPVYEQDLIVLIEPKLESGFPDVVAVYWSKNKLSDYTNRKSPLNRKDVRVLQYIYLNKESSDQNITSVFGMSCKTSIDKLISEKIIYKKGGYFKLYSKMKIGLIDRIITVEAKIGDWRSGIVQASNHFWLGEESYLLIDNAKDKGKITSLADNIGVRVLFNEDVIFPRVTRSLPTHGYWFMNEVILSIMGRVSI